MQMARKRSLRGLPSDPNSINPPEIAAMTQIGQGMNIINISVWRGL
jgi:hypothetical protein